MTEVTAAALAAHPFLWNMPAGQVSTLAATASVVRFPAGDRIFADGGHAGRFWLIQSGSVLLDVRVPGDRPIVVDSVGIGRLLGCSWLFPPYQWAFGAVCATDVEAFEFDGAAVRRCCEADPELSRELTRRLARVVTGRLQNTRMRLIAQYCAANRPVPSR